ncbi:hypothetical protein [Pyruvatibacter sp.]|uniref:hypothetical protein n=1 Tax=Pyruvatibacter sp. TaxID=1981328 RepID=UPI0032EBAFF1
MENGFTLIKINAFTKITHVAGLATADAYERSGLRRRVCAVGIFIVRLFLRQETTSMSDHKGSCDAGAMSEGAHLEGAPNE